MDVVSRGIGLAAMTGRAKPFLDYRPSVRANILREAASRVLARSLPPFIFDDERVDG
jgi:hypothetical protein